LVTGATTQETVVTDTGHRQDRRTSGQENRTVQNSKLDYPVSPKVATIPGH
jgi:hypothetical protein